MGSDIKVEVQLKPFSTPNFVIQETNIVERQDGFTEVPKYALKDIPPEILDKLCNEFRAEVFKKAQKTDPRKFAELSI